MVAGLDNCVLLSSNDLSQGVASILEMEAMFSDFLSTYDLTLNKEIELTLCVILSQIAPYEPLEITLSSDLMAQLQGSNLRLITDDANYGIVLTSCVHQDPVTTVKNTLPPDEDLLDLADLFKLFSDGTRVKMLYALLESELCVCDLSEVLGMTQSAVSHQLRTLRTGKMVKFRREGSSMFYSLADEHIFRILEQGMSHVRE